MARHKAVFIDRDGTLNEMVYDETHGVLDSPRRPEQVRMIRGAGSFLATVRQLGFRIIVVTNQPGIAKGTLDFDDLDAVNRRLSELLAEEGGAWDELRYSPDHPSASGPGVRKEYVRSSHTRKPAPGMLLEAARDADIDLSRSWMIGDGLNDVAAGKAAGCRTILVSRLKLEQIERFLDVTGSEPDTIVASLGDAIPILEQDA